MIRILVQDGDAERATHVMDRAAIRIGRDPSNDVVVRNRFVSSRHAEIRVGAEGLTFEDLCTTNGSRLLRDGTVIPVDATVRHRVALRDGDELLLGDQRHPVRLKLQPAKVQVFGRRGVVAPPREAAPQELDVAAGDQTMVLMPQQLGREVLLALHRLALRLATQQEPDAVLAAFGDAALDAFPRANHVAAWLVGESGSFEPALSRGRNGATDAREPSRTVRERVLAQGKAVAFTDGDEGFDLAESLHDSSVRAGLCAPLWDGRRIAGLVQVDSRGLRPGAFGPHDLETLVVLAHQAAMALANARLHEALRAGAEQVVLGFAEALEANSPITAGHSQAVASLCEATCLTLGLDPKLTRTVRRAALLHDVGMIGIPQSVVLAEHPTAEETELLRSHSELGARLLAPLAFLADLAPIVRHHHEWWDGTGWPAQLAGEDIPLGARILAACDAWHELVHGRPGIAAVGPARAASALRAMAGTRLDSSIVDALLEIVAETDNDMDPVTAASDTARVPVLSGP